MNDKEKPILTAADWQLIKQIFNELITLPEQQISERLVELCRDQTQIKSTVVDMVKVHFLSQDRTITPQQSAANTLIKQGQLKAGDVFGKYQIVETIGSGGMGQVYLAERDDEVIQRVAIKVLHTTAMDEQAQNRFDTERRILASLEHPNIARLIDAGSEQDKAYYVMEFIDGVPIDQFCQDNKLGLTTRLQLFLKICEAVSFAHSNLIVHRDLKPGNILVTPKGEVKLLDFGIAKPLKILPGTEAIHETMVGTTALTPQYAAPEQIKGQSITISCDVYVLGLLLYQMLTDQHAFELVGKTWGEIEQIITAELPILASKQVRNHTSDAFSFDQHSWQTKLKGDLDAILSHALKKEPHERYVSVREFAADVSHYLNYEPVSIKKGQAAYRLKKNLRKHWLPVSAMSLIFLVMVVSSFMIWQQSNTIKQERDKALTEKQVAEEVTGFLVDTFKSADPTQTLGTKLTAGDILKQGVNQLEQQNPSPQVKNRLLSTLAEVYMNLAEFEQAETLVNQVDAEAFDSPQNQVDFAYTQAKIYSEKGNANEAYRVIEDIEPLLNGGKTYFKVMSYKANLLRSTDRYEPALELAEQLLKKAEYEYGKKSLNYALQLRAYAKQINSTESRDLVIELYQQSIKIMEDLNELPNKMEWLNTMRLLLSAFTNNQQYDMALELSHKLEKAYTEVFAEGHLVFAQLYTTRGIVYANTDQPYESLLNHSKSNEIYRNTLGEESTKVAFTEINIAVVYLYLLGDFEQAKDVFESALSKFVKNSGKTNNYYYMRLPYATCLIKLNQYDTAKSVIAESIQYYQKRNSKSRRNLSLGEALMAHILIREGEFEEGAVLLSVAADSVKKHYGDTIHGEMVEKDLNILAQALGENL